MCEQYDSLAHASSRKILNRNYRYLIFQEPAGKPVSGEFSFSNDKKSSTKLLFFQVLFN